MQMQPTCKTRAQHADPPDKTDERVVLRVDLPDIPKAKDRNIQTDKCNQSTSTDSVTQIAPSAGETKSNLVIEPNPQTSVAFLFAIIATILGIMLAMITVLYVYFAVATKSAMSMTQPELSSASFPDPVELRHHKFSDIAHENTSETVEHLSSLQPEAFHHRPFINTNDDYDLLTRVKVPFTLPARRQSASIQNVDQFLSQEGVFPPRFTARQPPKPNPWSRPHLSDTFRDLPHQPRHDSPPSRTKPGTLAYPRVQSDNFASRQGFYRQPPSPNNNNNKRVPVPISNNYKRPLPTPVRTPPVPRYVPNPVKLNDRVTISDHRPKLTETRQPPKYVPQSYVRPISLTTVSPRQDDRQRGPIPTYVPAPPRFKPSNVDNVADQSGHSRTRDRNFKDTSRSPNVNYQYPRDAANIQDIIDYMTTAGHGSTSSSFSSSQQSRPFSNKFETRNRLTSGSSSSGLSGQSSNKPKTFAVMLDVYPVEDGRNTFRASSSQTRPQSSRPFFQTPNINSHFQDEEEPPEDNKHQIVLHLNLYTKKPNNQRNFLDRGGEIAFSESLGSLAPSDIYRAILQSSISNKRDDPMDYDYDTEDVAMSRDRVQIELQPTDKQKNISLFPRSTTTQEPEVVEGFDPIRDLPLQENHRFYESGEDYRNQKLHNTGLSFTSGTTEVPVQKTTAEYQNVEEGDPEELPMPWPYRNRAASPESGQDSDLSPAIEPLSDGTLITSELFE